MQPSNLIKPGTLIILCGPSASGKSTYASKYPSSWIINPDTLRLNLQGYTINYSQSINPSLSIPSRADNIIWDVSYQLLDYRMKEGLTTIFDATSLTAKSRNKLISYANQYNRPYVIVYFNIPLEECIANVIKRNAHITPEIIKQQYERLEEPTISYKEDLVLVPDMIPSNEELVVIGDVHGLLTPLKSLLGKLGFDCNYDHPNDLKVCFVGDLIDRGPDSIETLLFVKRLVEKGVAYLVKGNHEVKFIELLNGNTNVVGSTWRTYEEYLQTNPSKQSTQSLIKWINDLPYYYLYRDYLITHGNIPYFNIHTSSLKEMNQGYKDHNFDTDTNYDKAYTDKLIPYKLVRGHIAPTSPERLSNVIVLEDDLPQAFGGSILYTHLDKNETLREDCKGYQYKPLFSDIQERIKEAKDNKFLSITSKPNNTVVYKYTAKCYSDNTCWTQYPFLKGFAGLVISKGGTIIQHPFDKLFHPEELTNPMLPVTDKLPDKVLAVEKLNGYMIAGTVYNNKLFISTKGGNTDGEYIDMFYELIKLSGHYELLQRTLRSNPTKSFMFEVIHPKDYDSHPVIQSTPRVILIGARTKGYPVCDNVTGSTNTFDTEQQLDSYGAFNRPVYKIVDTILLQHDCRFIPQNTEGYILRTADDVQGYLCKLKNVFYNITKAFARKYKYEQVQDYVNDLGLDHTQMEGLFISIRAIKCPIERMITAKRELGELLIR
jgi:predicted kinase